MYYLEYDTDCEIKWMKATTDFDEIRDIDFVGENKIVALAHTPDEYEECDEEMDCRFQFHILIVNNAQEADVEFIDPTYRVY